MVKKCITDYQIIFASPNQSWMKRTNGIKVPYKEQAVFKSGHDNQTSPLVLEAVSLKFLRLIAHLDWIN